MGGDLRHPYESCDIRRCDKCFVKRALDEMLYGTTEASSLGSDGAFESSIGCSWWPPVEDTQNASDTMIAWKIYDNALWELAQDTDIAHEKMHRIMEWACQPNSPPWRQPAFAEDPSSHDRPSCPTSSETVAVFRLPFELLNMILSYLDPMELVQLSYSCKRFHSFLSSLSSQRTWKMALSHQKRLPQCPRHVNERMYAQMIWDPRCAVSIASLIRPSCDRNLNIVLGMQSSHKGPI
ncbi:hypothetical protein DL93DRAFT_1601173 [Clavulina sp. PMI_390]|nr:hypothetical protein DL93DRAFT_1601173 [Clavulina sp. PMI_390]